MVGLIKEFIIYLCIGIITLLVASYIIESICYSEGVEYHKGYIANEDYFREMLLEKLHETPEDYLDEVDILEYKYLDIPMSVELQDYTRELCLEYNIPFELVIALIDTESTFMSDLISSTNDYGLMQINKVNHQWLTEGFGITNFLDSKQNINAGVIIIQSLYHKYDGDLHHALMAYNMGEGGTRKARKNGVTSTNYSNKVIGKYKMYLGM